MKSMALKNMFQRAVLSTVIIALVVLSVVMGFEANYLGLLFSTLLLFLILGFPIAVALALPSLIYIAVSNDLPFNIIGQRMISGVDSFPLLAVPFFIMAGNLMNEAGVTERIFDFAKSLVGWARGGLGHVNIGASVIFSGMSGAAVADAGGLGTVEIKAMRNAGYDPAFSIGITAASSTIGPIIPPSIPLIIYGVMASVSIGQLFVAGIVPGLVMALLLMLTVFVIAHRKGFPRNARFELAILFKTLKRAFLSLLTPVIVVGGILAGVFTPTEAAVAAVIYSLVLGCIIYRSITLRQVFDIGLNTIETTASVLIIVAAASVFSWILTVNQFAQLILGFFSSQITSELIAVLMLVVIILVVGCFMETIAAITILVPVLLPVAVNVGIDPIHFGMILIVGLMIGLLTPPVGMVLYVLSKVSRVPFELCLKGTLPFFIPLLLSLLLIIFIPALSLFLPSLVFG